jgi:hypothetical protein
MTNEKITDSARVSLCEANEDAFVGFLKELKAAGIPQDRVYQCLLRLQRDTTDDLEYDRIHNWITYVTGDIAPEYRIWEERM